MSDNLKIPDGWKETTLGEALIIVDGDRGSNYPKNNELLSDGFCLFLSTKNVPNTSFCFDEVHFIDERVNAQLRKGKLEKDDFVLTTRGTIGNFAYYSEKIPYDHIRINSGMVVLRAKKELLENGFLEFFLKSGFFRKQVSAFSSGTAQPQLPIKDLRFIKMLLPRLPEQKAIADVLSSFDNKIELLREQNKTLEAIAQTIFNEWFVRFNFPDENGKPYQASGGKMIDSELGTIPEGWRVGKLGEEFKVVMGQSPEGESYNEAKDGIIFFQGRTDFKDRFPEVRLYTTSPKRVAEKFDVLVSVRAPVGDINVASEKCCIGRGLCAVRSNFKSYSLYKIKTLQSIFNSFEAEGTVFGSINKDSMLEIIVVVPSSDVVMNFEEKVNSIDRKIYNNYLQIRTLTVLRDELLPKLMKGVIRVKRYERLNE